MRTTTRPNLPDNVMEQARVFRAKLDSGATADDLIAEFSLKSKSLVRQRLQLLDLAPDIQALVENGELSAIQSDGVALAPMDEQSSIVARIKGGDLKSVEEVKEAGRAARDLVRAS
jgi:hypothetical protein